DPVLRAALAQLAGQPRPAAVLERAVLRLPERQQRAAGAGPSGLAGGGGPGDVAPGLGAGGGAAAAVRARVGGRLMEQMLMGAIGAGWALAGLFFFRFWRQTRDRFFLWFALSFWLEAGNRVALGLLVGAQEDSPVF